jgi:hypothetical protein
MKCGYSITIKELTNQALLLSNSGEIRTGQLKTEPKNEAAIHGRKEVNEHVR